MIGLTVFLILLGYGACSVHLSRTLPFQISGLINKKNQFERIDFTHTDTMVHIRVEVENPNAEQPLFVTIYTSKEVYSWTVPQLTSQGQIRGAESRTLCLLGQTAALYLSTTSESDLNYTMRLNDVSDMSQHLNISVPYNLAPFLRLDRQIHFFTIPENIDAVVIQLDSPSPMCAVVTIRFWNCTGAYANTPADERHFVKQTMLKQTAITIFKSTYAEFMIDIYVPSTNKECLKQINRKEFENAMNSPRKPIQLQIEPLNSNSYFAIVYYPVLVLALATFVVLICVCPPLAGYMLYPAKPVYKRPKLLPKTNTENPHAIKGSFLVSLISIATLYALPALQLLYGNQLIYLITGNEDTCCYNFKCLRPVGSLAAFNNVYSNVGYVIFGISFLCIVRFHSRRFTWRYREVFYAMGVALVLEGVLSAGYHVCPAPQNFQFDTTFMYVIAGLCIYHMYHIRNPDKPGRPHVFYCIIALAVFYVVVALLTSNEIFLIVLAVAYTLTALLLGTILTKKLYLENAGAVQHLRLERIMTGIHSVLNLALLGYTCYTIIEAHTGFPSALLYLFIGNMFFFLMFYVIMKFLNSEVVVIGSVFLVLLSLVAGTASLYFFVQKRVTQWSMSPAASREFNHECAFLDFFDYHDVWHMLSGFSIFVYFILLLILDVSTADLGAGNRRLQTIRQRNLVGHASNNSSVTNGRELRRTSQNVDSEQGNQDQNETSPNGSSWVYPEYIVERL